MSSQLTANGFLSTQGAVDDAASSFPEPNNNFSYSKMLDRYNRREKTRKIIGYTSIVATILIVTGLLISVLVVYCVNQYSNDSSMSTLEVNSTESETLCSRYGIASTSSGCQCDTLYNGACSSILSSWQQCSSSATNSNKVFVDSNISHSELESTIESITTFTKYNKQCQEAALPLVCLYFLPFCDCTLSTKYFAAKETCEYVRDDVCKTEWSLANSFEPSLLPDCSKLPFASNRNMSANDGPNTSNSTNISCSNDFIIKDGYCQPSCHNWKQYPEGTYIITNAITLVAVVVAIIVSIATIIISILRYKHMIVFPSLFLPLAMIDYLVLSLILVVSSVNNGALFCNDQSLLASLDSPTVYCTFSGALVEYVMLQLVCWWLCSVTFFYWHLVFPVKFARMKKSNMLKILYIFIAIIVISLPTIPSMIVLWSSVYKYFPNNSPTSFCIPDNQDVLFYSLILPMSILLAIGCCLIAHGVWEISKRDALALLEKNSSRLLRKFQMTSKEFKLLLVFMAVIVFSILIIAEALSSMIKRSSVEKALESYFTCEALGQKNCDRSEFEQYSNPYIFMLSVMLGTLIPITSCIFAVRWQKHDPPTLNLKRQSIQEMMVMFSPSTIFGDGHKAPSLKTGTIFSSLEDMASTTTGFLY